MYRTIPEVRPEPITWRTGNRHTNMLELKIDHQSGELYSVTLVLYDKDIKIYEGNKYDFDKILDGLPIVDCSQSDEKIIDHNAEITLYRKDTQFIMTIGDMITPSKCIRNGRVQFYIANDKLVAIGFFNLTDDEIRNIQSYVARSKKS